MSRKHNDSFTVLGLMGKFYGQSNTPSKELVLSRGPLSEVRVSGLSGHLRRQGCEASTVNTLKPRKCILLGFVDWKF